MPLSEIWRRVGDRTRTETGVGLWLALWVTSLTITDPVAAADAGSATRMHTYAGDDAEEQSACQEVVRARRWKEIRTDDDALNNSYAPEDPQDDWSYSPGGGMEQHIVEGQIRIRQRDYVLGVWQGKPFIGFVDDEPGPDGAISAVLSDQARDAERHAKARIGPVYLGRIGPDGVVHKVCEFGSRSNSLFPGIHVMSPSERLRSLADREKITLSQAAAKTAGLWGGQALLDIARETNSGIGFLSKDTGENALADAIIAQRYDLVDLYLASGVSPNLKRVKYAVWQTMPGESVFEPSQWPNDALFTAVAHGTPEVTRQLLERGANPDTVGNDSPVKPVYLDRALTLAVLQGEVTQARLLLDYGADPNSYSTSPTAVMAIWGVVPDQPLAGGRVAAIHQLLLHGAEPSPLLLEAFQHQVHARNVDDLMKEFRESTPSAEWIREAIAAAGSVGSLDEQLLNDTLAFRDAGDCAPGATPETLAVCLPNTLKHALGAIAPARRKGLYAKIDDRCHLHLPGPHNEAGWLSHVLGDQARAQCVRKEL